jgi:hypothetical protein
MSSAAYFINQAGDVRSVEAFGRFTNVMMSNGFTWPQVFSYNATYTGDSNTGSFSSLDAGNVMGQIASIVRSLSMNGVARLVVVINPGSLPAAQTAFVAAFDGTLSSFNSNAFVAFYGLSFSPSVANTVNFAVYNGLSVREMQPTEDLAALGFSRDPNVLATQVNSDLAVLDAAKYAALCGATVASPVGYGVTGNSFRLSGRTIIGRNLQDDGTVAAGAAGPASLDGNIRENGIWSGRAAVPA